MTEQTKPLPSEQILHSPNVEVRIYTETIGLDPQQEFERLGRWEETGECDGATPIGEITISDEALPKLESGIEGPFNQYLSRGPEHGLVPDDDYDDIPSDETMALLNEIQAAFESVIERDIQDIIASGEFPDAHMWNPKMHFGLYSDEGSEPHIDTGLGVFRYLVTIHGPGTTFFREQFPRGTFNSDGEMPDGSEIPSTAKPYTVATGTVVRFLAEGDPHDVPLVDGEVLRIFCDATVMPYGIDVNRQGEITDTLTEVAIKHLGNAATKSA